MPLSESDGQRSSFFDDPGQDDELPTVNETFWSALIEHIERDGLTQPRAILDVGCHTGGLLEALSHRFAPGELFGIEPLASARSAASRRLASTAATVTLFDPAQWDRIPIRGIDLIVSHEMLYLEPDLAGFMSRARRVLAADGMAYVVLGSHSENPLWRTWREPLIAAGHRVYDHAPIQIMEAAAAAGLMPSVQPLRRAGWVTYDPRNPAFPYPTVQAMFEHHYLHKLIFRLELGDDATRSS